MKAKKIDALIRLLADDDPHIRSVAREHLLLDVDASRPLLEQSSSAYDDPEVRIAAKRLLMDIDRDAFLQRWREIACSDDGPDLEEGAFLIAQVEYPDLDVRPYRTLLDDFARVLERRVSKSRDPDTVLPRLCHLLFREIGLRGNRENYYEPANSYLHLVLDRKLGIPITLSVVCILVARRLGLSLEGIGLPGHFIVRYYTGKRSTKEETNKNRRRLRTAGDERYFDPFNGGQEWSLEDCLQHLHAQGYSAHDEYLRAYESSRILIRILGNLLIVYENRGDEHSVARVVSMLEVLEAQRESRR